jgi:hypothetical protein
MAKQQASSSVSVNKIDDHMFDDAKEIDIAIEKSIFIISDKPSRCVAEWIDVDSASFVCLALNLVVQNNWQNKIRYTFDISNYDEIFDVLVLEKRIRIPVDPVISSLLGVSLRRHERAICTKSRKLGFRLRYFQSPERHAHHVFAGKCGHQRCLSKGSQRPASRSSHQDVARGQRKGVLHRWPGEGCCADVYTWWRLIGAPEK